MTWRPGEPIVCPCGAVFVLSKHGYRVHPSPWCEEARAKARERAMTDTEAERIREGVTFAGHQPKSWRRGGRKR